MAHQLDKRDFGFSPLAGRPTTFRDTMRGRSATAAAMSDQPLDPFTGSPRRVVERSVTAEPSTRWRTAVRLARQPSMEVASFVGQEPAEFAVMPDEQVVGNSRVIHLQQTLHGMPVFLGGRTVAFRSDGDAEISGTAVEAIGAAEDDVKLDVEDAIRRAARYVAEPSESTDNGWGGSVKTAPLNLSGFTPKQTASFGLAARPATFSGAPFIAPIKTQLTYFYQGPRVRLCWQVELLIPDKELGTDEVRNDYLVLVAAGAYEPGEVLFVQDRMCNLLGSCDVHAHNPKETPPAPASLPLAAGRYPTTLKPFAGGRDWLDRAATDGNSVVCSGNTGPFMGGLSGGIVKFMPASVMDIRVVHTFYFCNVMCDFFRSLGFDEAAGNFQRVNHTGASGSGDPVNARVFDAGFDGVATMHTPADGRPPTMKMGLFRTGNHSALDSDVVFHEFVHGVSNRLVGGPLNELALVEPQSRGMGEGWSDFFALGFQNALRATDKNVSGDWLTGTASGIRGFPYTDAFPDGFGKLGTGRYGGASPHPIGEIWCATLMKATRDLCAGVGRARGFAIAFQAVFDGLRLAPANPSFLDARDAILAAIDSLRTAGTIPVAEQHAAIGTFWGAFAHFGMGVNARTRGASLVGIVADYTPGP